MPKHVNLYPSSLTSPLTKLLRKFGQSSFLNLRLCLITGAVTVCRVHVSFRHFLLSDCQPLRKEKGREFDFLIDQRNLRMPLPCVQSLKPKRLNKTRMCRQNELLHPFTPLLHPTMVPVPMLPHTSTRILISNIPVSRPPTH